MKYDRCGETHISSIRIRGGALAFQAGIESVRSRYAALNAPIV